VALNLVAQGEVEVQQVRLVVELRYPLYAQGGDALRREGGEQAEVQDEEQQQESAGSLKM